jgi:hypothetical protein
VGSAGAIVTGAQRIAVRIERQQAKLAKIDEQIGRLMTKRVDEEEALADLLKISTCAITKCHGREHRDHIRDVCEGTCCTTCGGPIDANEECRC